MVLQKRLLTHAVIHLWAYPVSLDAMMNRLQRYNNNHEDLTGKLLVASPSILVPELSRAVMLVLQDSNGGVFAVSINRGASTEQINAWEELAPGITRADSLVSGGPMGGPVFAIHQDHEVAELELRSGLYVSCDRGAIEMLTACGQELEDDDSLAAYRIIFGVAGWDRNQLQREIDAGLWHVCDSDADLVFEEREHVWERAFLAWSDGIMRDVTGVAPIGGACELN